jgi:triosephosphate isomerase
MRKPIMAGNWKMNKTIPEAVALTRAICEKACEYNNVERIICPPFVCLPAVKSVAANIPIMIGAQNMHWADHGAYTGEISAPMLEGLVEYVLIGHSERRQYFGETDESVNKKVKAALAHGITPIVCVGESLTQNEAGETQSFVSSQVKAALDGLTGEQVQSLIVAYEPIWAIGTGRAATAAQANQICAETVRACIAEVFGDTVAQATRILYGGSTKPANIKEIMEQPGIDGALIGGASLDADSYAEMVRITSELYA